MTKQRKEHNNFDRVTLQYAQKASIVEKVVKRYKSYCEFFLTVLDKKVEKFCTQYSDKHKPYKFIFHGCKYDEKDDEIYSNIVLEHSGEELIVLYYGFGKNIEIKMNVGNRVLKPSKDGYNFFLSAYIDKDVLEKDYMKDIETGGIDGLNDKLYELGYGIPVDDREYKGVKHFLCICIDVKKFKLDEIEDELLSKLKKLFKNKKNFKHTLVITSNTEH